MGTYLLSSILAALNVIGSMLSIPVRWKTKAVPQIMAVRMRSTFPSILLSSLIKSESFHERLDLFIYTFSIQHIFMEKLSGGAGLSEHVTHADAVHLRRALL